MTPSVAKRMAANVPAERPQFPLLLTEKEAAKFLGVSLPYLRRGRSCGATGCRTPTPPFVRVGGRVYYRRLDLENWVNNLTAREVV